MTKRIQKRISIRTANEVARIFWPDFIKVDGCIFAAFNWHGGDAGEARDKTEMECFINHTHLFDEFQNKATVQRRVLCSETLDEIQETYDEKHPDFIRACELGPRIARMWAAKLKIDFPDDRFRVYYTQYDNPIVRFHKVRSDEHEWLSNDDLQAAIEPGFQSAVIYDTGYLERPVTKART
ncbi:MAG TPA: hypothetical protein VJW20_19170 [Candidatus Angelobacter sp.]|nr:hypothetical protein [Candidatus Angelobacter sp.]